MMDGNTQKKTIEMSISFFFEVGYKLWFGCTCNGSETEEIPNFVGAVRGKETIQ